MKTDKFILTSGDTTHGQKLILTSSWNSKILDTFDPATVTEIVLRNFDGFIDSDLAFLKAFPLVEELLIDSEIRSGFESLYALESLTSISIAGRQTADLDFSPIPNLKKCWLEWWSGCASILDCKELQGLGILNIKEHNLMFLSKLENLVNLSITQSPIQSLNGLLNLSRLNSLRLIKLSKLAGFSEIGQCSNLAKLEIYRCPKLTDISFASELKNLEILDIDILGKISSVYPLVSLQKLRQLGLLQTNVEDGNLRCLLEIESLMQVSYGKKRHYNMTPGEFYRAKWPNQSWNQKL